MNGLGGGAGFARLVDAAVDEPSEVLVPLSRGRFRRPLQMRLRLTPWWPGAGARTLVELLPEGRPALVQRYFDAGNALVDRVAEELSSRGPAAPPGAGSRRPPQATGASRTAA